MTFDTMEIPPDELAELTAIANGSFEPLDNQLPKPQPLPASIRLCAFAILSIPVLAVGVFLSIAIACIMPFFFIACLIRGIYDTILTIRKNERYT
jgi:hypothetical protein